MAISVDILSPERRVLQVEADSVVIPALNGEMGIMKDHAPLAAELTAGEIRLRKGDVVDHFAVSGGYVEVQDNKITVFAETAEMAQEIDVERARQAAERAKAALQKPIGPADFAQAEAALKRALVRLHAAESRTRRTPRG